MRKKHFYGAIISAGVKGAGAIINAQQQRKERAEASRLERAKRDHLAYQEDAMALNQDRMEMEGGGDLGAPMSKEERMAFQLRSAMPGKASTIPFTDLNRRLTQFGLPQNPYERMEILDQRGKDYLRDSFVKDFIQDKSLVPTDNTQVQEYVGPSHANGGIPIDANGNPNPNGKLEVEGGETKSGDIIFSDKITMADASKMATGADLKNLKQIQKKIVKGHEKMEAGGDLSQEDLLNVDSLLGAGSYTTPTAVDGESAWNKFKEGDGLTQIGTALGTGVSALINSRQQLTPRAITTEAPTLKTKVNVDPQISQTNQMTSAAFRNLSGNANKMNALHTNLNTTSNILADKENKETALYNQQEMADYQNKVNNARTVNYTNTLRNTDQNRKLQNYTNILNQSLGNIQQISKDKKAMKVQKDAIKQMTKAYDPNGMANKYFADFLKDNS